jgi:serine protease
MRIIPLLILIALSAAAQKKQVNFSLPPEASGQFVKNTVLAKLKPQYSGLDIGKVLSARSTFVQNVHALIPERQQAMLRGRISPRLAASRIDLSLYIEIVFDGLDIESFIQQLNSSGYFELVEPDYTATLFYTPSDPSRTNQYYLDKIKAYDAWEVTKGSPEVIIGIVDSGGDLNHPDIASQLFINTADPVDNIDNDNDGYVDNNRGWDFMGSDTLNINETDFVGDNNPNNTNGGVGSHGTAVAGCAAAATDNNIGISGIGFNSKLLFTKHSADNQGDKKGTIYRGYSGILYAATHGAKIINCSWGGFFYSQIQQDLINYVSLDLGCLIVAAAGNSSTAAPSYPASYDNVLSVASSNQNDVRSIFSNYGKTVDLIAPGENIFTTFFDDAYEEVDGTSFSAPITAGAAALVWAKNPTWTSTQVAEQIRVTADESIYQLNSPFLAHRLGKGRLDVHRALTVQSPSIRATKPKLINTAGSVAQPGEEAFLSFDFKNYLKPTSPSATITLTTVEPSFVNISKATIQPGVLGTNQTVTTKLNPFKLTINSTIAQNSTIEFVLLYSDGLYSDFQHISFLVNPSFLDIDDNHITTTIASNGRIGHENTANQSNGVGFVVNDNNVLYEMGVMMGTSSAILFDNVRSTGSTFNQEFVPIDKIREVIPGERAGAEIFGSFSDNQNEKTVEVQYRSLVWREAPFDRFVILEYLVKNVSSQPLTNFYFGLFADWDITQNGAGDVARWDANNQLGYVHTALPDDRPHTGIRLLKGDNPGYYAIDNNHQTPGVPFGLYDGYTNDEKFTSLSSNVGRAEAGVNTLTGADVSHVVSTGPHTIAPNETIIIAFALVTGADLIELQQASQQADTAYNYMLEATKPSIVAVETCFGSPATISATGASSYNWYTDFTGGEPIHNGSTFSTPTLFADTVFYVSNADESYESIRTLAPVSVLANPTLLSSGTGLICEGSSIILSVAEADSYTWSTGETSQSIEIVTSGDYSVQVQSDNPFCQGTSSTFTVLVNPLPVADFTVSGDLVSGESIQFTNQSSGANSYHWSFGDSQTSQESSPTHIYNSMDEFIVTLTATNAFGCSDVNSQEILVITGLDDPTGFNLYPIPAVDILSLNTPWPDFEWTILNGTGSLYQRGNATQGVGRIDIRQLTSGLHFMILSHGSERVILKFIKE